LEIVTIKIIFHNEKHGKKMVPYKKKHSIQSYFSISTVKKISEIIVF